MPFLQQQLDSFCRKIRSLPDSELGLDLTQQVQNHVVVLPVLQLDPVVLGSDSDSGKPGGGKGPSGDVLYYSS